MPLNGAASQNRTIREMQKMKRCVFCATAAALLLALFACKSAPTTVATDVNDTIDGVPAWVVNMSLKSDTVHYEVGYGRGSNRATSQKKAEADARNKIAMWLQVNVQTVLRNYTQDAGIGEESELIEFMEEVSKQTAETSLSGASIESVYIDYEGGVYVLMSLSMDALADSLQNRVDSYVRDESAAFAEFKAREAFRYLEGE